MVPGRRGIDILNRTNRHQGAVFVERPGETDRPVHVLPFLVLACRFAAKSGVPNIWRLAKNLALSPRSSRINRLPGMIIPYEIRINICARMLYVLYNVYR